MRFKTYDRFSPIQESLGSGTENFKDKLTKNEVYVMNFPEEEGDEELLSVDVEYSAELSLRNAGIEDVFFSLKKLTLYFNTTKDGGDTYNDIAPIEFSPDSKQVEFEILKLPFYITNLEVDMNNSIDPAKFKIQVKIGSDRD